MVIYYAITIVIFLLWVALFWGLYLAVRYTFGSDKKANAERARRIADRRG